jgi:phage shock protein PspC (stress-responsive transcriptional regulator)
MAVFCQQCGNALHSNARFCSGCGAGAPMAQPMQGRPLIRPHVGRQIGGVCLALSQANGWDVTTVRILTVIGFVLSSGLIGVAYIAAWIGIPEDAAPYPVPYPGSYQGSYQGSQKGPYSGQNQGSYTGPGAGPNPGAYPPQA